MFAIGVRPSINLKSTVKIVDGNGTIDNPYRLNGDNDNNLNGTLLNTRYSGEYIRFGNDENNLYRIVSHEITGLTKITSAESLKDSGKFITSKFGSNTTFSSDNIIGLFLNGEYLTKYVGSDYDNMIEDNTTWYLGLVGYGNSYKLAKYIDVNMSSVTSKIANAKVGLLRYGELMTGQFSNDNENNNSIYWTLTPYSTSSLWIINNFGCASRYGYSTSSNSSYTSNVRPSLNLKSNVIITSGNGTKDNPFILTIG